MAIRSIEYEIPEVEVILVAPEQPLASSPLENPEKGDEWGWD